MTLLDVRGKFALLTLLGIGFWLLPSHDALAAATGGGGMPYSAALTILTTSFSGEIPAILIICGVIGALVYWFFGGEIGALMASIVKVAIIGGIIGTLATGLTWLGVAGAVV